MHDIIQKWENTDNDVFFHGKRPYLSNCHVCKIVMYVCSLDKFHDLVRAVNQSELGAVYFLIEVRAHDCFRNPTLSMFS